MSHDHEIAEQAAKLVREQLLSLLINSKRMNAMTSLLEKAFPGKGLNLFRGLVLVSGSSAKAARFREVTGRGFPPNGIDCRPLLAESDEDFRRQWLEWTGKEHQAGDDHGPHTVIVFAGTGHSVFKLDPDEQDPKLVSKATEMANNEILEEISNAENLSQIMKALPEGKKYMEEHARLRKPSLPPEAH